VTENINRSGERTGTRGLSSCLTDQDLQILDADDDFVAALGYSRDALIGRDILALTHPDDRGMTRTRLDALLNGSPPFSITKRYLCADGSSLWVTNHVTLFHVGATRRLMATVELLDGPPPEDEKRVLHRTAECILQKRRLRSQYFDGELFGEAGFDVMLDLFVQDLAGRSTYTTSAAIASRAPLTTALRQIAMLVDRGLVAREPDPVDRRRVLLRMTDDGAQRMREYLRAAIQA
jgi:PAS domain S-box-containing protein